MSIHQGIKPSLARRDVCSKLLSSTLPLMTRMFLPGQVGITTRREQDYISLTDMVQRQH